MKILTKYPSRLLILGFIVSLLVYWIDGYFGLDPDFGWHIKVGELIRTNGIPLTDPFSYTMPSYSFIDHEWFTNLLMERLFNSTGMVGMAFLFALMAALIPFILLPPPYSIKELIVALLLWSAVFPPDGVRPQIIGWVFLAVLIRILWSKWEKYQWFFPILMLVWVNMHGSFALGMVIITSFLFFHMIKKKSVMWKEATFSILTLGVTLINPYTIKIWGEILTVSSDVNLKWNIGEWRPAFTSPNVAFFLFATLTGYFWWRYNARVALWKTFFAALLFLLAISANRHTILFVIFATPLCSSLLQYFEMEAENYKDGVARVKIFLSLLAVVALIIFLFQGILSLHASFGRRESVHYPQKAVTYLQKQTLQGEVFSDFNWGGYLVWKLPQKKVFVDGRMASWRSNYPPGESNAAFQEFLEIVSGEHINESFEKYRVLYVLWPVQTKERVIFLSGTFPFLGARKQEKTDGFHALLKKEGWETVYQDEIAVVYRHPLAR